MDWWSENPRCTGQWRVCSAVMRLAPSLASIAVAASLALSTTAAVAQGHFSSLDKKCQSISLQPNSDAAAFDITVRNVGCRTARKVVRSVVRHSSSRGYYCRFRFNDGDADTDLPHTDFRCVRGSRIITFVVS